MQGDGIIMAESLVCPYCQRGGFKNKKSLSNHTRGHKGFKPDVRGEKNNNWKGGRNERKDGYIQIFKPEHPNATSDRYVYEHRLVMELHLGRYLTNDEVVHHIDNNPKNNALNNLLLFKNKEEHSRHHALEYHRG